VITKEQKTRPAETYTATVSRTCDICKQVHVKDPGEWDHGRREETETEVTMKVLKHDYDGGGTSHSWTYDICPECFANKLAPWIEAQGGSKPRVEDFDW
jgi:hypothetical protein